MISHEKRISAARKLVRFGVLAREAYPEVPRRYRLTPFGEKFAGLRDGVGRLQRELESSRA